MTHSHVTAPTQFAEAGVRYALPGLARQFVED
jgi:hypothetical protein